MKKRTLAALCLASAAVLPVAVAVPASAGTTYSVGVIRLANPVANPKTIAVDSTTSKIYVGEANGTLGAQVTVLDPTGRRLRSIRVGDPYDPAQNPPPGGEVPPTYKPSSVVALVHDAASHTLVALVSDNHTIGAAYSELNGSFVVLIDTSTNRITKRYRVSTPIVQGDVTWADTTTVWTGMALDPRTRTLYGAVDYDPLYSSRLAKLNLTTGALTSRSLPFPDPGYPFPPPAGITFNRSNHRVYVSQDRNLYSFDSALRPVTTLALPLAPGACEADNLPSSAPSSVTASPATNTVYVNDCGFITVVNGATNTVTRTMPTTGTGVALDAGVQRVYTLSGSRIAIYSTATGKLVATVPVRLGAGAVRNGNGWFAVNTTNHKVYLPTSASTISGLVPSREAVRLEVAQAGAPRAPSLR